MRSSFVAYIDESGDEGFTFREDGTGSSRWFVISAVVFTRSNEPGGVSALRTAREKLQWDPKKDFHFSAMKHEHRLVLMHELRKLKFQTITIASHKPDIPDPERFQANKFLLYRYLARLLIERISWLCRDHREGDDADGTAELIFSDRASMSYDDLRNYMDLLRQQSATDTKIRVHWPAIDLQKLRAVAHKQLAGLQIADAVATSHYYGINLSRYGINDPSYLRLIRTKAYRHQGELFGYGVKFLSRMEDLEKKMPHLTAAFEDW